MELAHNRAPFPSKNFSLLQLEVSASCMGFARPKAANFLPKLIAFQPHLQHHCCFMQDSTILLAPYLLTSSSLLEQSNPLKLTFLRTLPASQPANRHLPQIFQAAQS